MRRERRGEEGEYRSIGHRCLVEIWSGRPICRLGV